MGTKNGTIKKTSLEAYSRPRQNGINAITINEGDKLLNVCLTNGSHHVVMATNSGRAIHFKESDVRPMGRNATGVRGIWLGKDENVIGMVCVDPESGHDLLVVSEKGYGKRSDIDDYRITKRGGKGVKTLNVTDKTGKLVAIKDVKDDYDLMIINRSGIAIRLAVKELRVMGRATQGVKLIRLGENDEISAVEKIEFVEELEIDENSEMKNETSNKEEPLTNEENTN